MFVLIITACFSVQEGTKCLSFYDGSQPSKIECLKLISPYQASIEETARNNGTRLLFVTGDCVYGEPV